MISQNEIAAIGEAKRISKSTIEKDWALGHFLAAIFSEPELKETLVFKGGTCLKKCYFPKYRFSEDLDFTSLNKKFELTKEHVHFICNHVRESAGILTHIDSVIPLLFKDVLTGFSATIRFWGADHSRNLTPPDPFRWQTKIKIEIILFELMIFDVTHLEISHTYSDKLSLNLNKIPCYSINEVMAEKLRALIQRSYTAPRDFYDIWYLHNRFPNLDYTKIVDAFHRKMEFKNLTFTGIEQLMNEDDDRKLRSSWKNSLTHQIQSDELPEFEKVKEELSILFIKIFSI